MKYEIAYSCGHAGMKDLTGKQKLEQKEARIYRTGQQDDCKYFGMAGDFGLAYMIDRCLSKKVALIGLFNIQGRKLLEK